MTLEGRLAGRLCALTGATGIAAATARRLAAEGARVHVVSNVADDAKALAGELGGTWAEADLADEAQAEAAFVGLDDLAAVLAIAGGSGRPFGDGSLHEVSLAAWEATLRLNLTTSFLTCREGVRAMHRHGQGGSVVLVASVAAFSAVPAMTGAHSYAAAKAGVIGLGHVLAATYAPDGIRANVIAPSLVTSPMSRPAANRPETVAFAERKQPLKHGFLDAEDIAATAAWLCSDDSRQVTGQVIAVDGGWSVTDSG
jgi:NAD(P)-dependent dehydrogenase (short-subunit alcohol dehydrogenase family)